MLDKKISNILNNNLENKSIKINNIYKLKDYLFIE